jgi:hypothetical protein
MDNNKNNNLDSVTRSYINGEITFQQYEALVEDYHIQSGIIAAASSLSNKLDSNYSSASTSAPIYISSEVEILNQSLQGDFNISSSCSDLSTLTPFSYTSSSKRKERKRTSSNNSLNKYSQQTPVKKKIKTGEKKIKDRFLSMKNIIKDNDNLEEYDLDDDYEDDEFDFDNDNIDDENQLEKNNNNKNEVNDDNDDDDEDDNDDDDEENDEDSDDEFDDARKWQDFDIETLNFDKFIKDHQTSNKKEDDNLKDSFGNNRKKDTNQQIQSSKRRLDNDVVDPVELKAKRRRNRVLPIEIQGLMGEANLAYARGDTNRAIDVCVDVIRYAPKASEPYQLLSLLYSEMGQNDKALRVGLIAAQLNKDPDEWIQLISQALIEGDPDLVLFCYNK